MSFQSHGRNDFLPRLETLEDRIVPSGVVTPFHGGDLRTSGAAFQTGSLLTVDVLNKPGAPGHETLSIVDDGKGDIQVSWDGGPVHSFTGVNQIVLNSQRTKTEDATFRLTGPLTAPLDVKLNVNGKDNTVTEHMGDNSVPSGLTFDVVALRPKANTEIIVEP